MIIQDHFIGTFYDVVKSEHPLVMVNMDVDAICASMILFHSFSCDDVHYSVAYVDSPKTFEAKLQEQKGITKRTKHIILINCYGHLSLDDAGLLNDLKFYIIDSRRPFHLDNIFSRNVSILTFSNEVTSWKLPQMEEVYMESDDSSEDEENDDEESDRALIIERKIFKRHQKEEWRRRRADIVWNYYEHTWYSIPSSVLLLELIHSIGKSNAKAAWCAAIGLSSQFADHLVALDQYTAVCVDHMKQYVNKFSPKGDQKHCDDILSITFDEEILLPLYRKWKLYDAMKHDITFCCSNALWSQKGENVLKHVLASIGITLEECRKLFDSIPSLRRKEIFDILKKHTNSIFATFFAEFGYHQRYSAIDFARIMAAKLELRLVHSSDNITKRAEDAKDLILTFFQNNGYDTAINTAITEYQKGLDAIRGLVFNSLHHAHVAAGAENFYVLNLDFTSDVAYLSSRHFLNFFVHFVLTGHASSKSKKRSTKPIIFFIPATMTNDENQRNWMVTGTMPYIDFLRETERKTSLPIAFRKVAERHNISIIRDSFDPNIFQIRDEDKETFTSHLDLMLDGFA